MPCDPSPTPAPAQASAHSVTPASSAAHPPSPPRPDARPRIVQDPVILGLTRHSRSKLGSRLFALFFVFVYALILVQLIWSLLQA